jgi:endoglucanase
MVRRTSSVVVGGLAAVAALALAASPALASSSGASSSGTLAAASSDAATSSSGVAAGLRTADDLGPEMVPNGSFDDGVAPWWTTADLVADTSSGALCTDVKGGTPNAWASIVGVDNLPLVKDESYQLTFSVSGTAEIGIRVLVQQNKSPWKDTSETNPILSPDMKTYTVGFTSTLDWPEGQMVFQIGAADEDWRFCVDDVSLRTGPPPAQYEADTGSRVRVNQVGYLSDGPKRATLVTDATDALPWTLLDASGAEVATGTTTPRGEDRTAGASVHEITFDEVSATGEGFTLQADGETSDPFAIGDDLYSGLRTDALTYFYLARSGIEIDGSLVGDEYARAAGHLNVAPNTGDVSGVGCQPPAGWYAGWTCDSEFDVQGGWYDAGDMGKYVVNGGIAVHQLLDTWERTVLRSSQAAAEAGPLGDGTAAIPEAGNGVPDVLDEARWELDWMARMQVPADTTDPGLEPYAGMVFHKIHDDAWTGLPLWPADDDQPRSVHRPSTAATLNVAAVAAKASRLFAPYDEEYAASLLDLARSTYAAAVANPEVYALAADGNSGGGAYDDKDVSDEFYWAAAELYLTTGEQEFLDAVEASPWATAEMTSVVSMDWARTAALGRMDLAVVPSSLPDRDAVRDSVVAMADGVAKQQSEAFFGQPYFPQNYKYAWGSNAMIANNDVVLATAYEISGDAAYRTAALEGLDYLFGRNALNRSYVTGYGTTFSENQHHRWMAGSLDPSMPHPHAGTLAGGPNNGLEDPVAAATWPQGCPAAQICYLDDVKSYSTNEMTVNWNSAMFWVADWAAATSAGEVAGGPGGGTGGEASDAGDEGVSTGVWVAIGAGLLAVMMGATVAIVLMLRRRAEAGGAEAAGPGEAAGAD